MSNRQPMPGGCWLSSPRCRPGAGGQKGGGGWVVFFFFATHHHLTSTPLFRRTPHTTRPPPPHPWLTIPVVLLAWVGGARPGPGPARSGGGGGVEDGHGRRARGTYARTRVWARPSCLPPSLYPYSIPSRPPAGNPSTPRRPSARPAHQPVCRPCAHSRWHAGVGRFDRQSRRWSWWCFTTTSTACAAIAGPRRWQFESRLAMGGHPHGERGNRCHGASVWFSRTNSPLLWRVG